MTKKIVIWGIVVIAASVGLSILFGGKIITKELGASPGSDSTFECESHNGVRSCFQSTRFNTASSTLCSFTPSRNATTTLSLAMADFQEATTVDMWLDIGKGAFETEATTTLFNASQEVGLNANESNDAPGFVTLFASTTLDVANSGAVFAPKQTLNFKITAKGADQADTESFGLSGICRIKVDSVE